ncbi:MAG: hypothetical protein MI924_18060 [Chloroflexales bacterium]|nr:hypothetical protein [Chloroflexales bacterium]
MPGVVEILQHQARQRGRLETNPLFLIHAMEARGGARVSHLPISQRLSQAWVTLTGAPFRPHQAAALAALRRGEPFALLGGGMAARQTLHLLLNEVLWDNPQASTLLLVPDEASAELHLAEIERLNQALVAPLPVASIGRAPPERSVMAARVIVATPDALHNRLLQHHDRAWQPFWSRLSLILLANASQYSGIAAAHLSMLLWRSSRLIPADTPLLLGATLDPVADADVALRELSGQEWRIIPVDDIPHAATTLALWRSGDAYLREAATLALVFQRDGYTVHITCPRLETGLVLPLIGNDTYGISIGPVLCPAHVHLLAGYPGSHTVLHQALDSGALLTVLLLGNAPIEHTLVRMAGQGDEILPLLDSVLPTWCPPPTNAYVTARHLLCAASELPLTASEIDALQFGPMVDRLEQQGQLVQLPDPDPAWQPRSPAGEPHADFSVVATGDSPIVLCDERGIMLDTLDPAAFDRWAFLGATLPPSRSSYRATRRDEDAARLDLRTEQHGRRTLPLRRCTVSVRNEYAQRAAYGGAIGWGRVVIEEEVYGYREAQTGSAPVERVLNPALSARWVAPAVWIDLPRTAASSAEGLAIRSVDGQQMGWSLVAALPLSVVCAPTDIVPVYDAAQSRIYLVDAQPGGNGLSAWLYEHLEAVLPLAYDIALDGRNDSLMEVAAQADKNWLLTLLGGAVALPSAKPADRSAPAAPAGENNARGAKPRNARSYKPAPQAQREADAGHNRTPETPRPTEPVHQPIGRSRAADPNQAALPFSPPEPPDPAPANRVPTPPARSRPARDTQRAGERRRARGNPPSRRRARAEDNYLSNEKPTAFTAKRSAKRDWRPTTDDRRPASPEQPPERLPNRQNASNAQPGPREQQAPPQAEAPPDAEAMIARLRRLREQREVKREQVAPRRADSRLPVTPRFATGDEVFCLPYGYGEVCASWIEDDKELLNVVFPDYGELIIDSSVSMVRRIEPRTPDND